MAGARRALIVANDAYDDPALPNLLAPGADADALSTVLGNPEISDFAVRVLRNETSYDVQAELEDLFLDCGADDVLLLHFSCHGLKNDANELFFATRNTRPDRLGSTAVAASFLQRCMRMSRSRSIVLLLDCCYSKAFGEGVAVRAGQIDVLDNFPADRLGGGRGRAVITASGSTEFAFESSEQNRSPRPSLFTDALVEGLATGAADRDEDGLVSLNELYDFVFDRVRERTPHQTPSRDIEMQGELYLARSGRRRVHAAPIPADLRAAVEDPNMFTRLGALSELEVRLNSPTLPVAAGALEALRTIADADIQHVADRARAVLRDAELKVDTDALHFVKGSAPRQTVRLEGPPLALACSIAASDQRIKVARIDGGLDVTADLSSGEGFSGAVTLTSPTGEIVIPVRVESSAVTTPPEHIPPPSVAAPTEEVDAAQDVPVPPRDTSTADRAPTPMAQVLERLLVPALVGIVLLMAAGMILPDPEDSFPPLTTMDPSLVVSFLLVAGGCVASAIAFGLTSWRRRAGPVEPSRRQFVGAGLLLGLTVASVSWLVTAVGVLATDYTLRFHLGFWLVTLAHLGLAGAQLLVFLRLRSRRNVAWRRALTRERVPLLLLGLGLVGTVALAWHLARIISLAARGYFGDSQGVVEWILPGLVVLVLAVVVPLVAAAATPRRFGSALLVGWAIGALATLAPQVEVIAHFSEQGPAAFFAVTLLALAVLAIPLARSAGPPTE